MKKISVIVPVYNVQEYIGKCLESLVTQTLKDIEIICINDGSTDDSLMILQNFAAKDKRIKVINKENGGVSSAQSAMKKLLQIMPICLYLTMLRLSDLLMFISLRSCRILKKKNSDLPIARLISFTS